MTTMVEPEWDTDTRALVLARAALPRCGVCGRDPSVCQDPARQFDWHGGDPIRCHATTAVLESEKRFTGANEHAGHDLHMRALMFPVRLIDQND